jgi:O-antigen/teichoic acid export membrane protein
MLLGGNILATSFVTILLIMSQNSSNKSQLKKNMVAGVICSCVSTLLMACSYPMYLRYLGYERYGLWLVVGTVLNFTQLSSLGLGQAVAQQVASDHALGDDTAVDTCVTTALYTLLVSGGLVCCLVVLFRNAITALFHLSLANATSVSSLLPIVGFLSLFAISLDTFNATLSGVGRIDLYLFLQLLSQCLSVLTTLILLQLHHGIVSFVIGNGFAYLIVTVLSMLTVRRLLGRRIFRARYFSWATLKKILNVSLYLMGCSILIMLVGPLNKLLLTRYVGVSTLPTYDIIINGSMKMRALIESAMRALMPEISRLAAQSDHANISRLNRRISKKLAFGGALLYLPLLVTCGFAIRLWLGKLAVSFPLGGLRIVLVATFFSLLAVPAYYTLLGLGKSSVLFFSNVIQSGVPVLWICAALLLKQNLSLSSVLAAVSAGLISSAFYLRWQNRLAINSLSKAATMDSLESSALRDNLCIPS